MKPTITLIAILLCVLALTGAAFGQTATSSTDPTVASGQTATPPSDPTMFVAFGGGFSQYTDPHYAMTGSFGARIAAGTYSVTSLDMTTRLDPATGKRLPLSTLRSGVQHRMAQSGPVGVFALVDLGATVGGGNFVGQVSGGGTLTYDVPKHPNLFLYASARILKSPQAMTSDPAVVQTAFAFGIGLKLGGEK